MPAAASPAKTLQPAHSKDQMSSGFWKWLTDHAKRKDKFDNRRANQFVE